MKNKIELKKLQQKFDELKNQGRFIDNNSTERIILRLSQMAYDSGDKDAFKFAEQDLKIISR